MNVTVKSTPVQLVCVCLEAIPAAVVHPLNKRKYPGKGCEEMGMREGGKRERERERGGGGT